jgi:hypothetical protein
MIQRFSEMTNNINQGDTKVKKAKFLVASVKGIASELKQTNSVVDKVYVSFSNEKKQFSATQIKKAILAFSKMDRSLIGMFKRSYSNLKMAVSKGLPTERISSQLEDLSSLRAKLAILRAQAAASVGLEGEELDEDLVEIDEAGYEVGSEDLDTEVVSEDLTDGEETVEKTGEETVEETVEETGEETVEELPDLEMDNGDMDNMMEDEILDDDMVTEEPVEEEEISASASLKKKKLNSSKVQSGGRVGSSEDIILKSLMEELSF